MQRRASIWKQETAFQCWIQTVLHFSLSFSLSVWLDSRIKSSPIYTKVTQKEPKQSFTLKKEMFFLKKHKTLPNNWAYFVSEYVSKTFQK